MNRRGIRRRGMRGGGASSAFLICASPFAVKLKNRMRRMEPGGKRHGHSGGPLDLRPREVGALDAIATRPNANLCRIGRTPPAGWMLIVRSSLIPGAALAVAGADRCAAEFLRTACAARRPRQAGTPHSVRDKRSWHRSSPASRAGSSATNAQFACLPLRKSRARARQHARSVRIPLHARRCAE